MTHGQFSVDDPRSDDIRQLLARHLAFARAQTPPEDDHALDSDSLLDPSVTFFSFRRAGELLAVGALKEIDPQHVEVKSMHTIQRARRRGIGRAMLQHLISVASERGYRRISLETGSMEAFVPARSLYTAAGFVPCEPFADYRPSHYSTYMTLTLDDREAGG